MTELIKYKKHGYSKHELYRTWINMYYMCYNKTYTGYKSIGALGVKICERWLDVGNFINDVKEKKRGMRFTRINKNKDYGPDNWEWVTPSEKRIRSKNPTRT